MSNHTQIIAITNMVKPAGEVPNGIVLYQREHSIHPFVVHAYTDNRSFKTEQALCLFQGDYCETLEGGLAAYKRRTGGLKDQTGDAFFVAIKAFLELEDMNERPA